MGPTWDQPGADRNQVGPMNFAIREYHNEHNQHFSDQFGKLFGDKWAETSKVGQADQRPTKLWTRQLLYPSTTIMVGDNNDYVGPTYIAVWGRFQHLS